MVGEKQFYPSSILLDYLVILSSTGSHCSPLNTHTRTYNKKAWHRLEDEATTAMNSQSDSSAPLSPPPQSEQMQEGEPVPLIALSEATADEGSTAPLAIPLSQLPLPEPVIDALPL